MKSLFASEFVFEVGSRAEELLPKLDLFVLEAFLAGCDHRLISLRVAPHSVCVSPPGFGGWLSRRFGVRERSPTSLMHLRYSNSEVAFREFFEQLRVFLRSGNCDVEEFAVMTGKTAKAADDDSLQTIARVLNRPQAYLGGKSVSLLQAYLRGDGWAAGKAGLDILHSEDANEWKRIVIGELEEFGSENWANALLISNSLDEAKAFESFANRFLKWRENSND